MKRHNVPMLWLYSVLFVPINFVRTIVRFVRYGLPCFASCLSIGICLWMPSVYLPCAKHVWRHRWIRSNVHVQATNIRRRMQPFLTRMRVFVH